MPSAALVHWQTDRMARLGSVDSLCAALLASPAPGAAFLASPPGLPPLAEESLQGYVMLVSGHFQGFCRDLYRECTQILAAALPAGFQDAVQTQCVTELKLNTGNPTLENIRKDFERFGFALDLDRVIPGNQLFVTRLGHLNHWRNAIAHQRPTPPPVGVPSVLTLANVQSWRSACDGLAISLDAIMSREMFQILGVAPW